jgi:hypothetical protein
MKQIERGQWIIIGSGSKKKIIFGAGRLTRVKSRDNMMRESSYLRVFHLGNGNDPWWEIDGAWGLSM